MGLTSNDLPGELLLTIFLLQPMKTLVLLRAVCKLWRRIISSKYFTQLFLSQQRTSSTLNKYFLLQNQNASNSKILVDGETFMYRDVFSKNYECYGMCDGLFCLSSAKDCLKSNSEILLWNPIFRIELPPLKKIKGDSQRTLLFFGYYSDDYKVLMFVFLTCGYYVCIYSLSTNDWKVIKYVGNHISSIIHRYPKARLVNGSAYFVEDYGENDHGIMYFNISREKFRKTKLPAEIRFYNKFIMEEYRESLALLGYNDFGAVIVMWVLKVSDDNLFSWDKIVSIKLKQHWDNELMGFINKDELVIWRDNTSTSGFLYNVRNECGIKFRIQETCVTTVEQSSRIVKQDFIKVGVVNRLDDSDGLRMYMIKTRTRPDWQFIRKHEAEEVDSTSTSNKYNVLADSKSNRYDVLADLDEEDIWSGC